MFERRTIPLATGDRIRITRNSFVQDKSGRIHNGTIHEVSRVTRRGAVVLTDGRTLPPTFAHLDHAYCVTSYLAQGHSAHRVIVVQSAESIGASSNAQFYVSASRGSREVVIFTNDKAELLAAASRSDAKMSATALAQHGRRPSPERRIGREERIQDDRDR